MAKRDNSFVRFVNYTVLVVGLCFIAVSCLWLFADTEEALIGTELKPTRYIPTDALEAKGVFLNNAVSISFDEKAGLYVSNSKEGNILKFSADGDFLLKIGRFGQAPGEFEFPAKVYPKSGSVFVLDSFRSGIQVFSERGVPQNQIRLFRTCSDFCINSIGDILIARGPKDVSDFLVDVLDPMGKLKYSIGNPLRSKEIPPGIANKIKIATDENDRITILFQTSGRLQTYDKNGKYLKEIPIITDYIAKDVRYNKRQFEAIQRGKRVGYHHIIESIRSIDGEYLLLRNGERRVEIIKADTDGKIMETYFFHTSEDYYAIDFDVLKRPAASDFYILEVAPECRIAVYSVK